MFHTCHPPLHMCSHFPPTPAQLREASRVITALAVDAEVVAVKKGKHTQPLALGPVGDEPDFDFKAMARREEQLQQVWRKEGGGGTGVNKWGDEAGVCFNLWPRTTLRTVATHRCAVTGRGGGRRRGRRRRGGRQAGEGRRRRHQAAGHGGRSGGAEEAEEEGGRGW